MKKLIPVLLISVFALLIAASIFLMSMSAPSVTQIKNSSFVKNKPRILTVTSEFSMESENWFPTHAYGLQFTIRFNNHVIGRSSTISNKRIKTGSFSIPVTIDYYLDSIQKFVQKDVLMDSIQATVELSGRITFMGLNSTNTSLVWLPMQPMNNAIFSDIASKNKFELEKIEVAESNLMKTKLKADFKLSNESTIAFNLESVTCDLFLDSTQSSSIAKWSNLEKQVIKAGASKIITGYFEVDHISGAYKGINKVINGNVDLMLVGKVVLERNGEDFEIPLKQKIPYNLVFSEISNVLKW